MSRARLMNSPDVFRRPKYEYGFAVNVFAWYKAPHAAIARRAPVIAKNKIFVLRNSLRRDGDLVAIRRRHIGFFQRPAIQDYCALIDRDNIARNADNALDVRLRCVTRKPKDDGIPAMNLAAEFIAELINEQPFLIVKAWHHAGSFHTHRAIKKQDDKHGDEHR